MDRVGAAGIVSGGQSLAGGGQFGGQIGAARSDDGKALGRTGVEAALAGLGQGAEGGIVGGC